LATTIVQWLDPQPEDQILDLGYGNGVLTANIRTTCSSFTGIDASPNLIAAAKKSYGSIAVSHGIRKIAGPGGTFAFEMGGHGNVAEVHAALVAAVAHQGTGIVQAQELCPWYFPSENSARKTLEDVGFEVVKTQMEHRPTKLTTDKEGGIEGWKRLMGTRFLEGLDSIAKREAAV
ncbi:MAG: hypothetical protein Q9209_007867, partial [Squamulea sp. 1 TL-2023]